MTTEPDEMPMPKSVSRDQARAVDRFAVDELGIPSVVLMENAAINCVSAVLNLLDLWDIQAPENTRVVVLCGGGNNGGDGYAIARHLTAWGAVVHILATKPVDELEGDADVNARVCRALGLPITVVDSEAAADAAAGELGGSAVIIDALLGTGFHGEVRSPMDRLIQVCNEAKNPAKVAVDTPSGLDCETGEPSNATFRADLTVTFVARKVGFDEPMAADWLGRVVVADIGIPPAGVAQALAGLD